MEATKTKTISPSGSLKADPKVVASVKKYCKDNGLLLTWFATEALKEKLAKEKIK